MTLPKLTQAQREELMLLPPIRKWTQAPSYTKNRRLWALLERGLCRIKTPPDAGFWVWCITPEGERVRKELVDDKT